MVVEFAEIAARPHPPLAERLESKGARTAVGGPVHFDQIGEKRHRHRGLHLAGMVFGLSKYLIIPIQADLPPVADKNVDVQVALDLAHEGREVVAAVTVDENDLSDAVGAQRADNLANHRVQRCLGDVNR